MFPNLASFYSDIFLFQFLFYLQDSNKWITDLQRMYQANKTPSTLHKKWSFPLRKLQETANLVTFTEEIPNGKLHFLCSASPASLYSHSLYYHFQITFREEIFARRNFCRRNFRESKSRKLQNSRKKFLWINPTLRNKFRGIYFCDSRLKDKFRGIYFRVFGIYFYFRGSKWLKITMEKLLVHS